MIASKKYAALMAALIAGSISQANAFGLGDLAALRPGAAQTAPAGNTEANLNRFLDAAHTADHLLQESVNSLFGMLASKEKIAELHDKLAAANSIQDPKEREAKLVEVHQEQQAALIKISHSSEAEQRVRHLDKKSRIQFGHALFNLLLAGLKDHELMVDGQNLLTSIQTNPMEAVLLGPKLLGVKDVLSSVGSQVSNLGQLGSGMSKLAHVGKIQTETPKSVSDAAKSTSI